jgi:hypothetical protein
MGALAAVALLVLAIVWAGVHLSFAYLRGQGFSPDELQRATLRVPLGDATTVAARVVMQTGALTLTAGLSDLLTLDAVYNLPSLAPSVRYDEDGAQGLLLVEQPALRRTPVLEGEVVSAWAVRLSPQAMIDRLNVVAAAGGSSLDLRGLQVRRTTVDLLAGRLEVNLDQAWAQNTTVEILGTAGDVVIWLPAETGVRVMLDQEFGRVKATGLTERTAAAPGVRREYVNDVYGKAATTLTVNLVRGVGETVLTVGAP